MDIIYAKILVSFIYLTLTLALCLIPVLISSSIDKKKVKVSKSNCLINKLNCFAGGVFLGSCLLDLYPDVIHHVNETLLNHFHYSNEKHYPIAEIFIILSFFSILFLEQLLSSSSEHEKNPDLLLIAREKQCPSTNSSDEKLTKKRNNMLMILSLVIHSIFEGIAIGCLQNSQRIFQLSFAILIHKSIISLSVGVKLMSKDKNQRWNYFCCFIFSSATPIGILLMLTMQQILPTNKSTILVNDLLRSFSCGTFLYITFFDILPHEFHESSISLNSKKHRLIKTLSFFIGFISLCLLLFVTKLFVY